MPRPDGTSGAWSADRGECWLSDCEDPFWGRPGRKKPDLPDHFRRTEIEAQHVTHAQPKSVFQIGGAGAVGTGSLRGMPHLHRLAEAGFSIWPFDDPGWPLVLEIYPRLLTGAVRKSDPVARRAYLSEGFPEIGSELRALAASTEDALDAAVSAVVMARHLEKIEALRPAADEVIRREGRIWWPGMEEPGALKRAGKAVGPDSPEERENEVRGTEEPQHPAISRSSEPSVHKAMWRQLMRLLQQVDSPRPPFPPTLIYNENSMLWLIMDWLVKHPSSASPIRLLDQARWFAEARLPSAFLPRHRGDPLAESHTCADAVAGHIAIGNDGNKAGVKLQANAHQLSVIEGKMSSPLSTGVTRARYFDQAARNVACIAQVLKCGKQPPGEFSILSFHVMAPQEQIESGIFGDLVTIESIRDKVDRRVAEYRGDRDEWREQWFLPTLDRIIIGLVSWESIIGHVFQRDEEAGEVIEILSPMPGVQLTSTITTASQGRVASATGEWYPGSKY